MKTAIILCGNLNAINRQAEELNSYIRQCFPGDHEIETWIVSSAEMDVKAVVLSESIRNVKWLQVRTGHSAEEYLEAITHLYELCKPQCMLFGSDRFVAGLAVRAAYRLSGASCIGVKSSQYHAGHFVVEKAVYSNNLTAKFLMKKLPFCISIAKGCKVKMEITAVPSKIEKIAFASLNKLAWLQSYKTEWIDTAEGLATAKVIIAVGNGIGSKENVASFERLAGLLGGKLGASRPVVMNAWTDMENLIGASGSILAPDVCIAVGVSGAAAFAVGIEKSKFIIAINKDEKAPIFKVADVAICAEYQEIVDELIKLATSSAQ